MQNDSHSVTLLFSPLFSPYSRSPFFFLYPPILLSPLLSHQPSILLSVFLPLLPLSLSPLSFSPSLSLLSLFIKKEVRGESVPCLSDPHTATVSQEARGKWSWAGGRASCVGWCG